MRVLPRRRHVYRLYGAARPRKKRNAALSVKIPTARMCAVIPVFSVLTLVMVLANRPSAIQSTEYTPTAAHNLSKQAISTKKEASNTVKPTDPKAGNASKPVSDVTIVPTLPPPAWIKYPLYVDPSNEATQYALANPTADGAALIAQAGQVPTATWFGDWDADVQSSVNTYVSAAARSGAIPVVVLYNIPQRDCGNYSAGGVANTAAYTSWVQAASRGIGGTSAVVIVEPDALAGADCLSSADQQARYSAIAQAVNILKANQNATVYLDAGNPAWQTVATMAARLKAANIAGADGFSLNVSNYVSTARNQTYGDQLSRLVGGKHYVIDTSRNGNSNISPDAWCNASAAAFGALPTARTGDALNDALLWVKIPWESDGTCNGGPEAGGVFWSFAVQLARNAGW